MLFSKYGTGLKNGSESRPELLLVTGCITICNGITSINIPAFSKLQRKDGFPSRKFSRYERYTLLASVFSGSILMNSYNSESSFKSSTS